MLFISKEGYTLFGLRLFVNTHNEICCEIGFINVRWLLVIVGKSLDMIDHLFSSFKLSPNINVVY